MKRLERLGSAAFFTIIISFVFHLIAMSFDRWIENNCHDCKSTDPFKRWYGSLRKRCYQSSMASIFVPTNSSNSVELDKAFVTEICIPNHHLTYKDPSYAYDCLQYKFKYPDTICSLGTYDKNICRCDYTNRTKVLLTMTIIAAFSLGLMLFLSHLISFVKIDYILRWLIPCSFGILIIAILAMIVTLGVASANIREDIQELVYSASIVTVALQNETFINDWKDFLQSSVSSGYTIRVSWCFGMEYLALHFAIITLILYTLMFMAKKRPEDQ